MIGGVEQEYRVGNRFVPPGELVENRHGWVEPVPTRCPSGHDLRTDVVGWVACIGPGRKGHRTHTCECGRVVYTPPQDPDCQCRRRRTVGG